MAKFRILSSRKFSNPAFTEFEVEYLGTPLNAGDSFRVFDTHHPVNFTVIEIRCAENHVTLLCKNSIAWSDQFAGAIVDTDDPDFARRFGYGSLGT